MRTTEVPAWRRAGAFLLMALIIPLSGVGSGVLFWVVHPLWLIPYWTVQGFAPTLNDILRWYAPGAFIIAPALASVPVGGAVAVVARLLRGRVRYRMRVWIGGMLGFLLIPPLAYALLLIYAGMWEYRALDVMMPTLWRAYGFAGGSAALVGALVGATVRDKK